MSQAIIKKTADYFKSKGVVLPSISELQNPKLISEDIKSSLIKINNNEINPLNLFRVHWFNKKDQTGFVDEPEHIVLPSEFTGVKAKIIVNIGRYFPLITAHKVLAAYGCLLPRILNGSFDYEIHNELKNARYLHENGLFVGNQQLLIYEQINYLAEILKR